MGEAKVWGRSGTHYDLGERQEACAALSSLYTFSPRLGLDEKTEPSENFLSLRSAEICRAWTLGKRKNCGSPDGWHREGHISRFKSSRKTWATNGSSSVDIHSRNQLVSNFVSRCVLCTRTLLVAVMPSFVCGTRRRLLGRSVLASRRQTGTCMMECSAGAARRPTQRFLSVSESILNNAERVTV